MSTRVVRPLPVLVAYAALAVSSQEPLAPAIGALLMLAAMLLPWRLPLDAATQRVAALVLVVLVIAGVRASGMPVRGTSTHLGAFGYGFALAPLAFATLRALVAEPEGGRRVDHGLALVALFVAGGAKTGPTYLALVLAFLGALVLAQRAGDPARPALAQLPRRSWLLGGAVLLAAGALAASARVAIFPLNAFVSRQFHAALEARYEDETGLSESVQLGRLTRMLQSSAVVLRMTGPPVDYLRGVVLDDYEDGRWSRATTYAVTRLVVPRERPRGADVIEAWVTSEAGDHLLLPLEARELATELGVAEVEPFGTLRTPKPNARLWFRPGPRDAAPIARFSPEDLQVPEEMKPLLAGLATHWAAGAKRPEEALAAIERHLAAEYTYTLTREDRANVEPVLDFLFQYRTGHCEYFASAMVLLARSIGIPARLVLGYRVGERNPHLLHWVVRQRNAHAWVEAQLPSGAWATYDPTPASELPFGRRDELAALREVAAVTWMRAEQWLAERSVFELGATAVLGVVAFAVQRRLRERRDAPAPMPAALAFREPVEAFVELERELAQRGLARRRDETLEAWATRLAGEPSLGDAARRELHAVVLGYAEARYGDAREEPEAFTALEAKLTATVTALRQTERAGA